MMSDFNARSTYVDSLNPVQRQMLTELDVDFLWGESLAPKLQKTVIVNAAPADTVDSVESIVDASATSEHRYDSGSEDQPHYDAKKTEPIVAATQEVASTNAEMARKMLQRAKHRLPVSTAEEAAVVTQQRVASPAKEALEMPSSQESVPASLSNELSSLSWQELSTLAATQEFELAMEQRVVSVFEDKSEGRQCDWLFLDQLFYLDAERYGLTKAKQVQALFAQMLMALGLEQSEIAVLPLLKSQIAGQGQATVGAILLEQINRLQPKCIVAFGDAAAALLQEDKGLLALMNQTQSFQHPQLGQIPVVTIFSPYYLLSNGTAKAQTWQGLKRARQIIRGHAL